MIRRLLWVGVDVAFVAALYWLWTEVRYDQGVVLCESHGYSRRQCVDFMATHPGEWP